MNSSKGRKGNRRADQNRIVRPNRQVQTGASLGSTLHTKQAFEISTPHYGYNNKYLTSVMQLLVGCNVQVQTTSGETYDGILQTASPKLQAVVLRNAHVRSSVNEKRQEPCQVPNKENLLEQLKLDFVNIICIKCLNVDLDYAKKEILQTDSMISGCNGPLTERELMPWQPDKNDSVLEGALEEMTDMSNGSVQYDELERVNSERFGFKSSFDDGSMSQYMDDIDKRDMVEYRERERRAEQAAKEIEKESSHKLHDRVDSGVSEEEMFSSVKRTGLQNHPVDGVHSHPPRSHMPSRGRGRARPPARPPPRFQHLKERQDQLAAEQQASHSMSNANRHQTSSQLVPPRRPDEENSGPPAQGRKELYSSLVKRSLPPRSQSDYTMSVDVSQGTFDAYQPVQNFPPRRIVPIPTNAQMIAQQSQRSQASQQQKQQQQQFQQSQPEFSESQQQNQSQFPQQQSQSQFSPQQNQPQIPQSQQLPSQPPFSQAQPPQSQPQFSQTQQQQGEAMYASSEQQQFQQVQQHAQPQFPLSQPRIQQQLQFLQQPHQSQQQQQQQLLPPSQIQVSQQAQVSPRPQSSPKVQHSPSAQQCRSQQSPSHTSVELPQESPQQNPPEVEFLQASTTIPEKINSEPEVTKQVVTEEQMKSAAAVVKQKEELFKNTKEVPLQKFGKVQSPQPRPEEAKASVDIASLKKFGENFKLQVKPEPKPQRRKERTRPGECGRTLPPKVEEKEEEEAQNVAPSKPETETPPEKGEEVIERLEAVVIEKKVPDEEEIPQTEPSISPKELKQEVKSDISEEKAPSPLMSEVPEQKQLVEASHINTSNNLSSRNSPTNRRTPPSRRSPPVKQHQVSPPERSSKLNPNAPEFVFNPNAREFTPQPTQKQHVPVVVPAVVYSNIVASPGIAHMTPAQSFTAVNTVANVNSRQQQFRKRGPYAVQSVAESAVASPAPAVFAHNPTFVQGTASQGQVYYIATQNVAYQGAPQHGQVLTAIAQQPGPQVVRYVIPQANAGVTPQHAVIGNPTYQEGNHPHVIYTVNHNQGSNVIPQPAQHQVMHSAQHGYHPSPSPQPHMQQQQQHYVVQQSPAPQYPQITSPHPPTPQGTPGPHHGLHRPPTPSHQIHSATPQHHAPQQAFVLGPVNGVMHSNFVGQPHGQAGHMQNFQHAN